MLRHAFKTRDQARFEVFGCIEGFHNQYRRNPSIGESSPAEFERRLGER